MKTLYIVDANVAVKWFVPESYQTAVLRLRQSDNELHVPEFFLLEFGNVVCKKWRRGEISETVMELMIEKVQNGSALKWHKDAPLFPKAFQIANQTSPYANRLLWVEDIP